MRDIILVIREMVSLFINPSCSFFLFSFFLNSCSNTCSNLDIAHLVHYDYWGNEQETEFLYERGYCEYDSILFTDGSWLVYKCKRAPMNSLAEFFDKDGRLIATWSQASECYTQYVIYHYDNKKRLSNLIVFSEDELENLGIQYLDEWVGKDRNAFLKFRNKIIELDYLNPDTALYDQINIEYDMDGDVTNVYKMWRDEQILAPKDYKLQIAMEPCCGFWEDDIEGGFFIFKSRIVPKSREMCEYVVSYYADFVLTFQQYYKDGMWIKSVLDPNLYFSEDKIKSTIELKIEGNKHIYLQKNEGDDNVYISTWMEELPVLEQMVSRWNTVLKQSEYLYDKKSGIVKIVHKEYDYSKKVLEESTIEHLEMKEMLNELRRRDNRECDLMNLLLPYINNDLYWGNIYREDEFISNTFEGL